MEKLWETILKIHLVGLNVHIKQNRGHLIGAQRLSQHVTGEQILPFCSFLQFPFQPQEGAMHQVIHLLSGKVIKATPRKIVLFEKHNHL